MKKYFLLITIFTIAIIVIYSCRKSFEPEVNPSQTMNSSNESELKIQSFLNRMHSDLKDEKTYSIDSAIWITEAALNYTYAIYDSVHVYLSLDTNHFYVELNENNDVNETDLETLYISMVDSLESYFDELTVNIKHLFYCDVIQGDIENGNLEMILVGAFACGTTSYGWNYFDEEDYWRSILNRGKCNGYSGAGDAAIRLTLAFNTSFCQSNPNVRIWFSDEITTYAESSDYYYAPAPNEHRAFWYNGTGTFQDPQCLSPEVLEYYMAENGIPYIIDDQNPDPENLEFESINILSNGLYIYFGGWQEYHNMFITYGVKNETQVPASEL